MLFRIEDSENPFGCHREYSIPIEKLPRLELAEVEGYIAEEIRKEVNNANNRKLLSYSKSLGVCLLKYNKYTDNKLHINKLDSCDFVNYYDIESDKCEYKIYSLANGVYNKESKHKEKKIVLLNFVIDVSDNNLLDLYLQKITGTGRKKVASPEKDKEVLLMQSPEDMVITTYLDSVYLLYALFMRYGMKKSIHKNLINQIKNLDSYRFEICGEVERYALIEIVNYLYNYGKNDIEMCHRVFQDSQGEEHLSMYYDPILQLHGIQNECFEDSFMLGDYNGNIVSDWIWHFYAKVYIG